MKKIEAGFGKLWDKAPAGIGEAVTKGVKGAGKALSKTADAFATNKDLQKYTAIALGAGALPIVVAGAVEGAPAVLGAAMQHPDKLAAGADFVSGFFDPGPPPQTPAGVAGSGVRKGVEEIVDVWRKRR
ncbi:hypothetical protein [Pseudodesulfovibrio mercurii]|uniref:hypothetical protein n=1 Tax=Pseudodesulfovibrio mercurii TaxID=641491 RepID=UPI0011D1A310|nr:hypothetical protein [Pseudodesulfovibrio mercurii]